MKLLNLILITLISLAIYTPANAQGNDFINSKTTFNRKITTDKLQVMSLKNAAFLCSDKDGNISGITEKQWFDYYYDEIKNSSVHIRYLKKNSGYYNNPVKGFFLNNSDSGYTLGFLLNDNKEKIQKGEKGSEEYEYPLYVQINGDWYGIEGVKIENESH